MKNLILIHFTSLAAHYSTPAKIGFPLAVYLLKKFDNVSYSIGTALILIELTVNVGMCGLFAIAGSIFFFSEYIFMILNAFLLLAVLGLTVLITFKYLSKNKYQKVSSIIEKIYKAFTNISLTNLIFYLSIICLFQIFSSINLVLLSSYFSFNLSIWQAVTASSAAYFLGAFSMIPMGLGVREASMLLFLNQFGIDDVTGISIVTIQRLLSTGLSFILGAILGMFLGVKNIYTTD